MPLILYAGFFPLWIMFFSMGVSLAESKREFKMGWLIFLLILSLILQFIESFYLHTFSDSAFGIKPSSFLFSAILIMILFSNQLESYWKPKGFIAKGFHLLGELSFGIYLTHCLVLLLVTRIPYNHIWIIDWFLVLSLDVVFLLLLRKLIPVGLYKYLGL